MAKPLVLLLLLCLAATASTACNPNRIGPTPFAVTSISPSNGAPQGGTEVTITGLGFRGPVEVRFGGRAGTVTSVTATQVKAITPESTDLLVEVVVVNGNGDEARLFSRFMFNQLVPRIFPTAAFPLETVEITGPGLTSGTRVEFGGVAGTISAVTTYGISLIAPAHPSGVVDVVVTTEDGRTATLPNAFTFLVVDVCATPTSIASGGVLTVKWSNPIDDYWDNGPDTIALYRVGDPNDKPVWSAEVWEAVSRKDLAAPAAPGDYEFRFLIHNNAYAAGRSKVINVVGIQTPSTR